MSAAIAVSRYRDLLTRASEAALLDVQSGMTPDNLLTAPQIDLMVSRYAAKLARRPLRKIALAVRPIRPRRSDERAYDRALRRVVLRSLMRRFRAGLSEAVAAAEAIERLDGVPLRTSRMDRLVQREVDRQAAKLQGYHRRRLIGTFRNALGIDIRPVLREPEIKALMDAWRRENVDLIRTIPERAKDGLYRRMTQAFAEAPFDQQRLAQIVAEEGKVSGYNLRRITRDQTSKAIGQLTRARHLQLGIESYIWRTARDGRVRDSHAALEGTEQRWDTPAPGEGRPGEPILCRCSAEAVIPDDFGESLQLTAQPVAAPGLSGATALTSLIGPDPEDAA